MQAAKHQAQPTIINLGAFFDKVVVKISAIVVIIGFIGFLVAQTVDYQNVKQATKENTAEIKQFKSLADSFLNIQKKNHAELIRNQERNKQFNIVAFQLLFEKAGVMTWESGPDGTTIKVSRVTCEKLHLQESDLLGTNWILRIPISERAAIMSEFRECLVYKRDFDYIYTFKDGYGQMIKIHAIAKYGGLNWLGTLEIIK